MSEGDPPFSVGWFVDAGISLALVLVAGMMSGLTMGLVSLDATQLSIVQRLGDEESSGKAKSLLWFTKNHHLTLVTLLLANAGAAEALPLFLDKLVPEYIAIILSVTFVLIFGEIIPSAVCTGPQQVNIASFTAPLVYVLIFCFFPIAYPIAKLLDLALGDDHEMGTRFQRRTELREFIRLHGKGGGHHVAGSGEEGDGEEPDPVEDDEAVAVRRRTKERERIRRRLRKMHVLGMFLANSGEQTYGASAEGQTNPPATTADSGRSEGGPLADTGASVVPQEAALPPSVDDYQEIPELGTVGGGSDSYGGELRSFSALVAPVRGLRQRSTLARALQDAAALAEQRGADDLEKQRLDDLTDGFLHYGGSDSPPVESDSSGLVSSLVPGTSVASAAAGGGGGASSAGGGPPLLSDSGALDAIVPHKTQSTLVTGHVAKRSQGRHPSALPPLVRRSATHVTSGAREGAGGVVQVGGRAAGAVKRGAAGFFVFRKQPAALPGMAVISSPPTGPMSPRRGIPTAATPLLGDAALGSTGRSLNAEPQLLDPIAEGTEDEDGAGVGAIPVRLVSIGRQATPGGPSAAGTGSASGAAPGGDVESMMLSEDEVKIMSGCLMLGQLTVGDVAQPDVFALSTEDRLDARTMQAILGSTHSRIPVVYGRDKHKVAGLLLVKLLIPLSPSECKPIREVPLLKPIVLHPDTTLLNALNVFQTGRGHLAVVTREVSEMRAALAQRYPPPDSVRILGIVTLENLLEELIQEDILDEMDVGAGAMADGAIEAGVVSERAKPIRHGI